MDFDIEDPLACFKEQKTCTITELFASESDHMPSPNCSSSAHFHVFHSEAISLILQVQVSCDLDPFVAYLAINYLHRFISSQEIPNLESIEEGFPKSITPLVFQDFQEIFFTDISPLSLKQEKSWLLKLAFISSLSLASKMMNTPLSFPVVQKAGCNFKAESIQRMELVILGALNWRMRSITPFPFLNFFTSLAEIKEQSLKQALKERASEIIFNAHNDIKFLEYKPSTIAATSLICASHELFPQQYPVLRASITACEYVNKETLSKCFDLMQKMVRMEAFVVDTTSSSETPVSVLYRSTKRQRI